MYWEIPQDRQSEWSVIEILGTDTESYILPKIIVPKKYLKIQLADTDIVTRWVTDYISTKANKSIQQVFEPANYK